MKRIMLGISKHDRKIYAWIWKQTNVVDNRADKTLKWNWAQHVARRNDDRRTNIVMKWRARDKRRLRRSYQWWRYKTVKLYGSKKWMRKAENRKEWKRTGSVFTAGMSRPLHWDFHPPVGWQKLKMMMMCSCTHRVCNWLNEQLVFLSG